ncbi:MAG TPA: TlpA disulfide reductase family protein [Chitinophagaceae bacterium]|nr:TlpA disulfide reductase family protein [Chitinophagaceae bacterium]
MKIINITIASFLISTSICCNNQYNTTLALGSWYTDTLDPLNVYEEIKPTKTIYDSAQQRVAEIQGIIDIPSSAAGKTFLQTIKVEVTVRNNRRMIKMDTNGDNNLLDEYWYKIDENVPLITFKHVKIYDGDTLKTMTIFGRPMQNELIPAKTPLDITGIGIGILVLRKEVVLPFDTNFHVGIINLFDTTLIGDKTTIMAFADKGNKQPMLYRVGHKIFGNYNSFVVKDVRDNSIAIETTGMVNKNYGITPGSYALSFNGKDVVKNRELAFTGASPNLLLIDFWGTWCKPCTSLTEKFKNLHRLYAGKLDIIGIAADYSPKAVADYLTAHGVPYSNIYEPIDGPICSKYNVTIFPCFILIDKEGKIIFRETGSDNFDLLAATINRYAK